VQRLVLVHDHRAERASPVQAVQAQALESNPRSRLGHKAVAAQANPQLAPRPVWLMPEPQPLPERQARPWFEGGALQLLSGPERIEAGWWDAGLAERDYFIAQAPDGALLWIYRARLPLAKAQGWFLQGRFG
jgi:protein ImuB